VSRNLSSHQKITLNLDPYAKLVLYKWKDFSLTFRFSSSIQTILPESGYSIFSFKESVVVTMYNTESHASLISYSLLSKMEGAYSTDQNVPTMFLSNKISGNVNIRGSPLPYSFVFMTYPTFQTLNTQIGSFQNGALSNIDIYKLTSSSGVPSRQRYETSTYFRQSFSGLYEIIYEGPGKVSECFLDGSFSYSSYDTSYRPDVPSEALVLPRHSNNLAFNADGISRTIDHFDSYFIIFIIDNPNVLLYDSEYGGNIISRETYKNSQFSFREVYYTITGTPCNRKRQLLGTNYVSSKNNSYYHVNPVCFVSVNIYDKTSAGNSLYYYNSTTGKMKSIEKNGFINIGTNDGIIDIYVKNSYCYLKPIKSFSLDFSLNTIMFNVTDDLFYGECTKSGKDDKEKSKEQTENERKYNRSIILGLSISGGIVIFIMIITTLCCCCGCCWYC